MEEEMKPQMNADKRRSIGIGIGVHLRSSAVHSGSPPFALSLVIPVRDEERSLDSLLESIAGQTRPPDEIVFVDGGSRDGTVEKIAAAGRRDNRIRVIEAGAATPGRGRNLGIAAARHDWIALTDAGIRLEPGWLEALVAAVESDPAAKVVYGNFEPVMESYFERCASLAYVQPKAATKAGLIRGPSIASCLIHREVWKAAGGFPDQRAAEDLVFMERVRALDTATALAPSATVWWHLQPSLQLTFRKFALYSKHNVLAGRARYWHYGVARMYLAGLPFVVLALIASPWWILLPVLGFVLRVAKSIWDRRESLETRSLFNPIQFAAVGLIIAAIDLATFFGWAKALLEPSGSKRRPPAGVESEPASPCEDRK